MSIKHHMRSAAKSPAVAADFCPVIQSGDRADRSKRNMYQIIDHPDKSQLTEYEAFICACHNGSFTQSAAWAQVKAGWGHYLLVSCRTDGALRGAALVLHKKLPPPFGGILYSPRGPVGDLSDEALVADFAEGARELAHRCHACFYRCDPWLAGNEPKVLTPWRQAGFRPGPQQGDYNTIQPRTLYVLPLAGRDRAQILADFHPKWRYNLRLAQRRGVVCALCGEEALDEFYELMIETGRRDGFTIRPKAYFSALLRAFGPQCARLFICRHEGRALSGALCIRYGGKACYLYGASSSCERRCMPNHLMQWEMICWALDGGCTVYDFGAIPHWQQPQHPDYGIYRFKKGFGGQPCTFAGELDLVSRPAAYHLLMAGQRWDCFWRKMGRYLHQHHHRRYRS
ncbi:Lipid II:glycine glycyltransferase [Anaerotruncus sp. 2789STDY5834896]|uniref:Lipid II:glycine glycyltransferase n=1 Tax=uncultured Anaerotruncus sp. TaxID=905011 RepID=A0A1C6GZR1_9FIRM|nr:Lipid II:glycine glycyltransferase [uncultured Anaerotruncus sp.]